MALAPGSTLVTYTDGVTDAVGGDGTRYGVQRPGKMLAECCQGQSADDVIEALTHALSEFQVGAHADDTAALLVRRLPSRALAPEKQTEVRRTDAMAASS